MSLSSSDPEQHLGVHVWNARELEQYLRVTMEFCKENNFSLTLNEKHRRSMIRAVLGISKSDYKQQLRNLQLQEQWKMADGFIRNHLLALLGASKLRERAPKFADGIHQYKDMSDFVTNRDPHKFFSSLAGGREYQGNMERLLQDMDPHLLPTYQEIVKPLPELDLLQLFVEEKCARNDTTTCHLLRKCLDMTFSPPPSLPADGGRSKGKQGEVDLTAYLESRIEDKCRNYHVLSPVWIRERNPTKNKNISKHRFVLEVPPGTMKFGMTNEFDAMVVSFGDGEHDDNRICIIEEVWDAKATMDPVAMHDILHKKLSSLRIMLQPEILVDTKLVIQNDCIAQGQAYDVVINPAADAAASEVLPQIGLFGSRFPPPKGAAQRLQVTICERLLETDWDIVQDILSEEPFSGKISPPQDIMLIQLSNLMELVRRIQPILAVVT
jgi:hypothetical protein